MNCPDCEEFANNPDWKGYSNGCPACEKRAKRPVYHSLLPEYVQDMLKRAAKMHPDNERKRRIYIDDAIESSKRECPEAFKHAGSLQ